MRLTRRRLITSGLTVSAASFTISGAVALEDAEAYSYATRRRYRCGRVLGVIARVGVAATAWAITAITVEVYDLYMLASLGATGVGKLYSSGSLATPTPSNTVAFLRATPDTAAVYEDGPALYVTGTASNAAGTTPVPVTFALLVEETLEE
jgi:hypothetical protein